MSISYATFNVNHVVYVVCDAMLVAFPVAFEKFCLFLPFVEDRR